MIVAQTNEQVDDLVAGSPSTPDTAPIGRLSAAATTRSPIASRRPRGPNVAARSSAAELAATRSCSPRPPNGRWSRTASSPGPSSTRPTRCAPTGCCGSPALADTALFVGDPGQLDPFATVETDAWAGPELGPERQRGRGGADPQPAPAGAPPALLLAAARVRRAGGVQGVLPLHRVRRRDRAKATGRMRWNTRPFGMNVFDLALRRPPRTGWALYELRPPAHAAAPTPRRSRPAPRWPPGCCSAARSRSRSGRRSAPVTADRIAIGGAPGPGAAVAP